MASQLVQMEETLILVLRTYLQRVSARLSAAELVELVKAAIALLASPSTPRSPGLSFPGQPLSLCERKQLLQKALHTFSNQRSQPIPPFGHSPPSSIDHMVDRLEHYQRLIAIDGIQTPLNALVGLPFVDTPLSPSQLRTALDAHNITVPSDGLEDLAQVLQFERQLQTAPSTGTPPDRAVAEQIQQAIAQFKARYQPSAEVTQPKWDDELSISSTFFNPS